MKPAILRADPAAAFRTTERCRILELCNSAGDPALSIALATVAPGETTQLHRLHGVDERYLILHGEGLVSLGRQPPEAVGPGDLVVIPAGTTQQIANTGDRELAFYCLCTPRFTPACYEALGD
ncbi:cupin domain-containing protein [Azotobacter chroococcum]|uniref:cupin domain-containing protein n=1 Tax=Azotobacter chroococcum TaxID=353 RepID=UPI0010AE8451|nr:cupin domain-containing protein [Azotobacter chroococcum]TKD45759.1 cupin domain-containing protein [Azotobacter chroococcum]